jgi:hypothetical protein
MLTASTSNQVPAPRADRAGPGDPAPCGEIAAAAWQWRCGSRGARLPIGQPAPARRASARRLAGLPVWLALTWLCPTAMAETSPWYLGLSQAVSHESNLYRVDSATPLGALSRSDTVSNTSLVAGLDQPLGRQRLFGNARLGVNRYSHNDYLDDSSYKLTAGLDWSTIERLSGNLGVVASRSQRSFNVDSGPSVVETRKNNEAVAQVDAAVRAGVVTRLSLEAGLGHRRVGYSAPEYQGSQYRQDRGSLGLQYRPGIAAFGASWSLADSRYDATPAQLAGTQAAERVRRSSLDLTLNWPASGASSVYARLSPTRVVYDQFTQRDFSGLTGALKWDWAATGKLRLETRLVHDISQDSSFETFGGPAVVGTSNTGRTTTEWRLALGYEATAKIALNVALGSAHRALEQSIQVAGQSVVTASGSDDTGTLSIGMRWVPLRSLQLGCDVAREQRAASGGLTQDHRANTLSCYGQFTLQ